MSSPVDICSSFIEGAPPGELNEVVNDIKTLTSDTDPSLIQKLEPAFQKYNEEQLLTVKLPGASQPVRSAPFLKSHSSDDSIGLNILAQPPLRLHLLRHPHLHILHIRPHRPETQQHAVLYLRLPALRPRLLDREITVYALQRTLPSHFLRSIHRLCFHTG